MRSTIGALVLGLAVIGPGPAKPARAAAQTPVPAHPHGTLPESLDCGACHTPRGWTGLRKPLAFDHEKDAGVALDGRHAGAPCAGCHLDLRFDAPGIAATECSSCHLDVHQGRLAGACTSCHNTTSFRDAAGLDRHTRTRFPLDGAHVRVACVQCHTEDRGGLFTPVDTECLACHRGDYSRGHEARGGGSFDSECQRCHRTSSWTGVAFDHASLANGFALQGRHQLAPCEGCHTESGGLRFQPGGMDDCIACHRADYAREHDRSGFPTRCADCHTAAGWERGPFDHAAVAHGWELTGRHTLAACTSCHLQDLSLRFHPTGTRDCVACHRPEYDQTHAAEGYPVECAACHTSDGWAREPFDHAAAAKGFVLVGKHQQSSCGSCHIPPGFASRFAATSPDDCIACHQADYDREHAGTGFPTTCSGCHDSNDWRHAVFDHLALAGFALTGAHESVPCASCHNPADNTLLFPQPASNQDCVACHQADYDANHAGTGFPSTCASCHTATQWAGATFDHTTTGWELQGAHATAPCASCHNPADNTLLFPQPASNQDCVACHQADYDANHAGTGFPSTCASCHTTTQWTGATFNHAQWFPIYSGKHANKWQSCAACHTVPNDYTVFTCMSGGCHGQSKTDNDHSQVGGYAYDAVKCLACHPTGN